MKSFSATVRPAPTKPSIVAGLRRHAEDDEQNHDRSDRLRSEFDHRAQRIDALVLSGEPGKELVDDARGNVDDGKHQQNPEERLQHVMKSGALAGVYQRRSSWCRFPPGPARLEYDGHDRRDSSGPACIA